LSEEATAEQVRSATDNDVVLKAVCYGLAEAIWPAGGGPPVGVLGAARYVLAEAINRASTKRDKAQIHSDLQRFLDSALVLEPTELEISLAVDAESAAQKAGVPLDTGESQLAAITVERGIPALETGDKRAIHALEELIEAVPFLGDLCGRVRCLEQIMRQLASHDIEALAEQCVQSRPSTR
jgi:hypothetical protein